jgi:hypothetical protein
MAGPTNRRRWHRLLLPLTLGALCSAVLSGLAALVLQSVTPEPAVIETRIHQEVPHTSVAGPAPGEAMAGPRFEVVDGEPAPDGQLQPETTPEVDEVSAPGTPPDEGRPRRRAERPAPPLIVDETGDAPPPAAPLDMSPRARAHREVQRADDGTIEIPRDVLMSLAYDEPLMRAQARRVTPWFENGECQGVRVEGAGPLLRLIGVMDGDVITHAGGIVIDSPHRGLAAWDALRERDEVSLGLVRNGRRFTQRYRLTSPP